MSFTDKQIKLAEKEGGKKGQDIAGLYDMGGMSFFHVVMESCEGSLELLQHAMNGANTEVPEGAEERKGGAGHLGKMFLSANDQQVALIVYVPKSLHETVSPREWVEVFQSQFDAEIVEESEEQLKVVVKGDKDKERFPLKMRDEIINLGFAHLVKKGLVRDDEDDDMLDGDALEEAGIEW